ncbi:MAG: acetate--CoA ligase family protein, partial [Burkholderiaceae bacterium]
MSLKPVHYRVDVSDTHAHTFGVTLTIPEPAAEQVLSLPVWIAGSYMVREFGRHLSRLEARQGRVTREVPAHDADAAVAAARDIGWPVVLKGVSRAIVHKSDLGLVH